MNTKTLLPVIMYKCCIYAYMFNNYYTCSCHLTMNIIIIIMSNYDVHVAPCRCSMQSHQRGIKHMLCSGQRHALVITTLCMYMYMLASSWCTGLLASAW